MSHRAKFLNPMKYPGHWLFWGGLTVLAVLLLTVSPALGLVLLALIATVAVLRWFGVDVPL